MPNTPLRHNCPICYEDCPNLSWYHPQRTGDARHGVCQGCNNRINQCPLCRQGRDAPSAPCKSKKRRRSPGGGGKKPRKLPTMPKLKFGKRKIYTGKKGGKYYISKGKKIYLTKNKTKKSRFGSDTTQLHLPCYLRNFTREDWMSARVSEWVLLIRSIYRADRVSEEKLDVLQAEFGNNKNFVKGYKQVLKAYSTSLVARTNLLRQENARIASERDQIARQIRTFEAAASTPRRRSTPSPPRSPPRLSRSTRRMNRIGKTKRKIYTGKKGGKYIIRNGKKHYI